MSNEEFEILLLLNKQFVKSKVNLPIKGESNTFDIISKKTNDKFYLDIDRSGRIELFKLKIQTRYVLTKLPLVRVDVNSPPHLNPDGTKTSRNHIHVYRETINDTGNLPWAYDLETFGIFSSNINFFDFMQVFYRFCEYCNIETYNIEGVI